MASFLYLLYNESISNGGTTMDANIAYQNKDIISKMFADSFGEKSLKVYGLDIPKIVKILPTNLPTVSADELRIDNLFLLEDGTVAIIDYESAYKKANRNKYINYIARVLNRYEKEGKLDVRIRMIVIYTADVRREQVDNDYDLGAITFKIENAFLSEINSEEVMERLTAKVNKGEQLTEEELMEFIVLPLTYKEKERKQFAIEKSFELARQIDDDDAMTFVLSGLLVFTDKVIDDEMNVRVKEWIAMTKVGRLFQLEKEEELAKKDVIIAEREAALANEKAERAKDAAKIKELEALLAAK